MSDDNKLPPPKKTLDIAGVKKGFNSIESSPINIPPLRDVAAEEESKRNIFKNKISGLIIGVSISFALMGVSFWWGLEIGRKSTDLNTNPIPVIRSDPEPIKVIPDEPGGLNIPHKDIQVLDNSINTEKIDEGTVVLLPEPEKPILPIGTNDTNIESNPKSKIINSEIKKEKIEEKNGINLNQNIEKKLELNKKENNSLNKNDVDSTKKIIKEPIISLDKNKSVKNIETNLDKKLEDDVEKSDLKKNKKNDNLKLNYKIQLASYRSEESAFTGWEKLSKKYKDNFKNQKPTIEKVNITNKGTFYRLQTGNFLNKKNAQDFCNKLKLLNLNCLVIKK